MGDKNFIERLIKLKMMKEKVPQDWKDGIIVVLPKRVILMHELERNCTVINTEQSIGYCCAE